ncbi:MAG: ComEC/Rec2 family competence protein [Armatimonadetes bacterium]|nr:ComEC/Rec2 family competence protein [Armatimonadota bacterium]
MRDWLRARPLVSAFAAMAVGSTLWYHPWSALWLVALALFVFDKRVLFALLFGLLGLWIGPHPPAEKSKRVEVLGMVMAVTQRAPNLAKIVSLRSDGGWIKVAIEGDYSPQIGDKVAVEGILSRDTDEPSQYGGTIRHPSSVRPVPDSSIQLRWAADVPGWMEEQWNRNLAPPANEMAEALVLRSPQTLPREEGSGPFNRLTAGSLHVYLVGYCAMLLARLLPIPWKAQLAFAGVLLFGYWAMTGFQVTALRAGLMFMILGFGPSIGRVPDLMSAFALSGIICLIYRPDWAFTFSFQSSAAALTALGLYASRLSRFHGLPRMLAGSGIVYLAIAPLYIFWFGQVPLFQAVISAGIVFLAPFLSIAALLSLFSLPAKLFEPIFIGLHNLLGALGGLPGMVVSGLPAFHPALPIAFYLCLLLTWRPHARPA